MSMIITMCDWREIDLLNIEKFEFTPDELALPVCMVNRYAGGLCRPLSVGEHSVRLDGCKQVQEAGLGPAAICHDLTEGVMTDLINPMKRDPAMKPYLELEERFQRHLFNMWGIPWEMMEELSQYDRRICEDEVRQLRPGGKGFGMEPLGVYYPMIEEGDYLYWYDKMKGRFNEYGLG
jgi:hypothetical protein